MQYTQDDYILTKYKAILYESRNGMCHDLRSNQVNKNFSKIITNGVFRSTYRKSAERRSSVQKSKFDNKIIIRG